MKISTCLICFLVSVFLFGCSKPDHRIRVNNQYAEGISNLTIGPAIYGSVASGGTSIYQPVPEGSSAIHATIDSTNMVWKGSASVSGNGTHNWTVTLSNTGGTSIKEDK